MTPFALLERLRDAGIDLGLEDGDLILDGPVDALPDDLLEAVRAAKPALVRWLGAQEIRPRAPTEAVPLSFQQQRLWFLDQLEPGSTAYALTAAFRLQGALDVGMLQETLGQVVARHAALRTRFPMAAAGPIQEIVDTYDVNIEQVEMASYGEAQRWLAVKAAKPFDLASGPLLRVSLLKLGVADHILAVNMHHIISDGWSVSVLIRDVALAYAGATLASTGLDYADYATWQRGVGAIVQGDNLAFWQQNLADAPVLSTLLTDHTRPSLQRHQGAAVDFTLAPDVVAALAGRAKAQGTTLFAALLAGYAEVLARHARQDDLVIGTPVANRTRPGLDEVIGFFVNMLPLRLLRVADISVDAWLARTRDMTLAAFAHQDLPFDQLVDGLGLERQLSHAPLFQTVLALQTASEGALSLPGLQITPLAPTDIAAKYDIAVTLIETSDGGLSGQLAYDTDLFLPERMQRLAGHLTTLLSALARAGGQVRMQDLVMFGIEERALLTGPLARGEITDAPENAVQRIMALASADPSAPAIDFEGQVTSRAELEAQANRLARALLDQGLQPGQVVGVHAPPSAARVAAILAIARAGGVLLALDAAYPVERLAFIVADAKPSLIIGGPETLAFAPDVPRLEAASNKPATPVYVPVTAEQPAYIIYTSGSTGRPKGVVVPRRGLGNLIDWQIKTTALQAGARVSALARFGFDGSLSELWPTLTAGGTLVVAPEAISADPAALLDWWAGQTLYAGYLPTPLAEQAMATGRMPQGLRCLFTGGDRLRHRPPVDAPYELLDFYGPTECAIVTIAGPVPAADGPFSIGRPVFNTRIYLLDPAMNLAPLGGAGEVFIAGPNLAQGYLGQPGQTAAVFLPDPFGPPGTRLYRSGDLARWLPDGRIAYLGRSDQQISLRGYRIEPGEIESILQQQPGVSEAFIIEDEGHLIAYLVARDPLDKATLRARLSASLPEYMVPQAFVQLDALPLTPNGKVDRRALPRPDVAVAPHQPPKTPTEVRIAAIWAAVLRRETIGRQDNFFALGGHSLTATQAMSRLRAETGLDLPLRQMFEAQTLAALAERVDLTGHSAATALPRLQPRVAGTELPLSFAQARLWFLDQLEPGNPFYAIPGALRLEGLLDLDALNYAFSTLIARHESLRTRIILQNGRAMQVVDLPRPIELPLHDIADPGQLHAMAEAEARRPFDLAQGPLLRARVLRIAPQDHVVLVNMHHIISDGWSMGVVVQEFAALYTAKVEGRESPLLPLLVQYGDFAVWQRNWLAGERLAIEEAYWQQKLGDLPQTALQLPLDRPRPLAQSHRGATHSFALDTSLTKALRALATAQDATLFMVLNAAYAVLLARYSGQQDIAIGSPIANRRDPALENMIGFFVNTLVLRHDVQPASSFADFLLQVRQTALEAFDHQDLPFEHLVDLLKPDRSLDHSPIFQVSFALQNAPAPPLVLPGLTLRAVEAQALTAKFDLSLTVFERDGGLHCDVEYATDLFDPATIVRFADDYALLLGAITKRPTQPLHALEILSAADLDRLAKWNNTDAPAPAGTVVDAFRARVAETPDAPALRWNSLCWTYAELDRRSDRLSHALRAAGVTLGTLVALGCGRGPDHVSAMLAVAKAGGTAVMLPTDAPAERLHFILSDTGLSHLVGLPDPVWPSGLILVAPDATGHPETSLPDLHPTRAYVVYTSGTTGRPKGSINSHAGLINKCVWYAQTYGFGPGSVVSAVSNLAFDGILAEVWPALVSGACIVMIPTDTLRDPWLLQAALLENGVDTMYLPMGYLETLATTGFDWPASLRRVLAGGDRMKGYLLPPERGLELVNVYGPSETQSISSVQPIGPDHSGLVSIGKPIPNVRFHILDAMLNPLPPGAAGELCIAGIGVGEGYLNRPGLTADRFIPDPFGPAGSRMYRSGDMARYLPDGQVDFLGRQDGQLKIRGFRIELAEVEQALLEQPQVADAVVIPQPDPQAGHRLVAYVVPRAEAGPGQTHWETTFDQIYDAEAPPDDDAQFDIIGWTDSYTGAQIPPAEMAEWLDETISRIAALNPTDVLEIGVGTGMILHRIAPQAASYTGTDLSQKVLDKLGQSLGHLPCPITLQHAAADDWSRLGKTRFDTVILNSVAQYFPSLTYFSEWLESALARVDSGHIFLGDIRHFGLAEAFALSVVESRAAPDLRLGELRQQVAHHLAMETELLVDPAWFFAFAAQNPRINHVHIVPKKGKARNELVRFRYDVVLEIAAQPATSLPEKWRPWLGLSDCAAALAKGPSRLALRDIPSALCTPQVNAAKQMRQLPETALLSTLQAVAVDQGIEPADLLSLAQYHGYALELGLGPGAQALHAVFHKSAQAVNWASLFATTPRISARHANTPFVPERNADLIASLMATLTARLPGYMVPWRVVVLGSLPLTGNGKVDRRALPVPLGAVSVVSGPRGVVLAGIARVWGEVLGISPDAIGDGDNFFTLGGHSLLATQVISKLRAGFGIELALRVLFEAPTLVGLAPVVEAALRAAAAGGGSAALPAPVAIVRPKDGGMALSFAQQRLWFLDQLDPGDAAYHLPVALRLTGPLDVAAFGAALNGILARHEVLRSTLVLQDGRPVQRVQPVVPLVVALHDLSGLPQAQAEQAASAHIQAEAERPFDLGRDLMLRASLLRLGPDVHVSVVVLHHIAADGWSMGVLLREIAALYEAALGQSRGQNGTPDAILDGVLPPLPVQYADYAAWQRDWLQGPVLEGQLDWWRGQLQGMGGLLALPTDHPRPAVQSHRGGTVPLNLPAPLVAGLTDLARAHGATLHMVLVALLSVLMSRWSGQDDVALGTPVAGRRHQALEGLIGFFVNTLVLRNKVAADQPFDAFLAQVREGALAAQAHQDLPFEHLVEALAPARDLSHAPLFQVMLALQNAPMQALGFGGLTLEPLGFEVNRTKFDLTFGLQEMPGTGNADGGNADGGNADGGGMVGQIEYATDLFAPDTIARLAGQFLALAQAVLAAPETPVGHLALMTPPERSALLDRWQARPGKTLQSNATLADLFAATAAAHPDRIALRAEGVSLTYKALNARANQLAHALQARGITADSLVGLACARGIDMITGILAILKAGGAYLPLDPDHPDDRLAYMLSDAKPTVVLADPALHARLKPLTTAEILPLQPAPNNRTTENPTHKATQQTLAYVIYTSGSTGKPKGVMVPHGPIINRVLWLDGALGVTPEDRIVQKTPYGFDVSVGEIFLPLIAGGLLVIARPGGHVDVPYLARLVRDEAVTIMHFVPPMVEASLGMTDPADYASLRAVMCSGQALPRAVQDRFDTLLPHIKLHNLYGPTETAVEVTHWPCHPDDPRSGPGVPIGRAIDNVAMYVLDDDLEPVPTGVPGHLFIAGMALARGYLNRPDLTAGVFVPDPYAGPGSRMYRSGDRARYLANGAIDYLGRADDQLKIRGVRIEPGEVEAAIMATGIREAVVMARPDQSGELGLIAYVVSVDFDENDTRQKLADLIPDHLMPSAFVVVQALPLTANGKVDRKALPAPDFSSDIAYVAPRTETEARIAAIWASVLGHDRIGINDNFFRLGGHSLRAVMALNQLRQSFDVEIGLEKAFALQTVAMLARHVDSLRPMPAIPSDTRKRVRI
jgi:amino acid adenylation domain-containing protein